MACGSCNRSTSQCCCKKGPTGSRGSPGPTGSQGSPGTGSTGPTGSQANSPYSYFKFSGTIGDSNLTAYLADAGVGSGVAPNPAGPFYPAPLRGLRLVDYVVRLNDDLLDGQVIRVRARYLAGATTVPGSTLTFTGPLAAGTVLAATFVQPASYLFPGEILGVLVDDIGSSHLGASIVGFSAIMSVSA